MIRRTIAYAPNLPQVRVAYVPNTPLPPASPIPPITTYLISGSVAEAGVGFAAALQVDGLGTITSAASGSYGFQVISGYSGTVIPHQAYGTFDPALRMYTSVGSDSPSQHYAFYPDLYFMEGFVTNNGTSASVVLLTDGLIAISPDVLDGYYAYDYVGGWSGTIRPIVYITNPSQRVYSSQVGDLTGQDFDAPTPFLFSAANLLGWSWSLVEPNRWFVAARNPVDSALTVVGTVAGTATGFDTGTNTGTYYSVYGVNGASVQNTYQSNEVMTTPPLPSAHIVTGALTDSGTAMVGIGVEMTSYGTLVTNGSGTYSQYVPAGWSGSVVPHSTGGTFSPEFRTYVSLGTDAYNQDFAFYGTTVSGDCPLPGTNVNIPLPMGNNASRNVIDPINNLLWVIDESNTSVYYVDVVAGTYAGSVDVNSPFGSSGIAYDRANRKVLVTTYDGSLAFINPVTKAVTFSDFVQRWPNYHMLAVSDAGTAFVADYRNDFGWLYEVNCATEQLITRFSFTPDAVFTDSIAYAENIQKLVLMSSLPLDQWFFVFDPVTGVFTPSVLQTPASFSYENYYVRALGHMLMSRDGSTAVEVVDISAGANATILTSLSGPTRISDATEDTCRSYLFVSNGNDSVWEYTLDGSYALLNQFDNGGAGLDAVGLAHSRATNLVYYEQWSGTPIPVRSITATFNGQFIADIYAALKTFDGAAAYTPGVAVVTDGSYGPSFSGVMSGSLTGVANPEDYEVRIYHVADIGYFQGTGVFSYADIGFTGSYGYSYSGSAAGTVANYAGSSAQYRVDVYVRTDADYFQQSSNVFIAALAWGGSYAYGYTGSVFGRVTDLDVAEFGSYRVGVYARIPGDTDYIQGTSSIDPNGWFSVNPVFSGDKVAKLERLSDSEIFGQTDTAGSNAWASNQGLDPGIKVAKIVRLSDDRIIGSTDSAGAGKWTFGDSGTNCRLIQLYQRSNGSLVAETYFGQGLLRSYNVPLSDPDWWVLGHRNYTYDQAAAVVAACQMDDQPTAERWVGGLMAAVRVDDQWSFAVNAISGQFDEGYYRNGAQFWCGYALLFFVQKFPASLLVPEVTAQVQRWLTAMEAYWKTDPDFQQNTYTGGRGRYILPLWTFDAGYTPAWSSTEHNTDAYFAVKLAGTVLGDGTLVQRAADIGAALQTNYWFSGSDRGYQGQSNGTTHDTAHALDVGSWLSFVFRSLGDSAKQQACVDITSQYAVSMSGTISGYTAYLAEYGYPLASDSLWVEGTFGVVLAKYANGAVAQAVTEYNQLQPLLTATGFSYVVQNDPSNELRDWTSVASTAWGIIAARPGGFWEIT